MVPIYGLLQSFFFLWNDVQVVSIQVIFNFTMEPSTTKFV